MPMEMSYDVTLMGPDVLSSSIVYRYVRLVFLRSKKLIQLCCELVSHDQTQPQCLWDGSGGLSMVDLFCLPLEFW